MYVFIYGIDVMGSILVLHAELASCALSEPSSFIMLWVQQEKHLCIHVQYNPA